MATGSFLPIGFHCPARLAYGVDCAHLRTSEAGMLTNRQYQVRSSRLAPSRKAQARCTYTMRTAGGRSSWENLFDLLFMAPYSQILEPPQFPGHIQVHSSD